MAILIIISIAAQGARSPISPTRTTRSDFLDTYPDDSVHPTTRDHYHWAYGLYVCDRFLEPLTDEEDDVTGIHTHDDGIVHIHPFSPMFAGDNATLGEFFAITGVSLTSQTLTAPDPVTGEKKTFETCNGQPVTVKAALWAVDRPDEPPKLITSANIHKQVLNTDRMAITIALMPGDKAVPEPPSLEVLDRLTDVAPRDRSTTTTRPRSGGSSTTGPGTTLSPDAVRSRGTQIAAAVTAAAEVLGPDAVADPAGQGALDQATAGDPTLATPTAGAQLVHNEAGGSGCTDAQVTVYEYGSGTPADADHAADALEVFLDGNPGFDHTSELDDFLLLDDSWVREHDDRLCNVPRLQITGLVGSMTYVVDVPARTDDEWVRAEDLTAALIAQLDAI